MRSVTGITSIRSASCAAVSAAAMTGAQTQQQVSSRVDSPEAWIVIIFSPYDTMAENMLNIEEVVDIGYWPGCTTAVAASAIDRRWTLKSTMR